MPSPMAETGTPRKGRLSKSDTPGENSRRTRRNSHLEEPREDTPTRLTRSTRKAAPLLDVTVAEVSASPRRSRRVSQEQDHIPTPIRITRRSASVTSDDGSVQPVAKPPAEPTILEEADELPVARRTRRAASVTSEDGVQPITPAKRGRKSQAVPTIQEEETEGLRPTTRSMSVSPQGAPLKEAVVKMKSVSPLEESPTNSPKKVELSTPKIALKKTPSKSPQRSVEKSAKKTPKKAGEDRGEVTPKAVKSPKAIEKTPQNSPKSPGNRKTPMSTSKVDESIKRIVDEVKESLNNSTDNYILSPKNKAKKDKNREIFSKSWSQAVSRKSTEAVDTYGLSKSTNDLSSVGKSVQLPFKKRKVDTSSDESEEDEEQNPFVDNEAMVAKNYETDDSKDADEKAQIEAENEHIEATGIELGSEDSEEELGEEEEEDSDSELGSFIATDEETNLLEYSDEDEGVAETPQKKKKRPIIMESSSDEEIEPTPQKLTAKSPKKTTPQPETPKNDISKQETPKKATPKQETPKTATPKQKTPIASPKKETPKKDVFKQPNALQLPKIRVGEKIDTGDSQISFSVVETTIFEPNKSEVEPMEVDESTITFTKDDTTVFNESGIVAIKRRESLRVNDSRRASLTPVKEASDTPKRLNSTAINGSKLAEESSDDEFSDSESENEKESQASDVEMEDNVDEDVEIQEEQKPKKPKVVNVTELGEKFRDEQLNALGVAKNPEALQAIVERCDRYLDEINEKKKVNRLLHKKEKELKKKEKKAQLEETSPEGDELAKKKKKRKFGRKYNEDVESMKQIKNREAREEEIQQLISKKKEMLERRRERKKAKKLAKLEKLKAAGIEVPKKKKKVQPEPETPKPVEKPPKQPKSTITAYEMKLLAEGKHPSQIPVKTEEETNGIQENGKILHHDPEPKPKKLKKSDDTSHNKENKMLKILSNDFREIPMTPEKERLKKNRGFHEAPATPKPIGFKVEQILPTKSEFTKVTKKRKRVEKVVSEPLRVPPKQVWTSSGPFAVSELSPVHSEAKTEFAVQMLQQPAAKKRHITPQEGLSSFKHKALYENRANVRTSSKELRRMADKKKLLYRGKSAQN